MEVENFSTPYKKSSTSRTVKLNRARTCEHRACSSSSCCCCCCVGLLSIGFLASVATICVAGAILHDRLQRLESLVTESLATSRITVEHQQFRSQHVECFRSVHSRRTMFISASNEPTQSINSSFFVLAGYRGQLQLDVVQATTSSEYLSVKYRPISGPSFPMFKMISILLLNPHDDKHNIQKQFNTREEIYKGASMFSEPNGGSWGTNFCTVDIVNRYVNNDYLCVEVKITDLIP